MTQPKNPPKCKQKASQIAGAWQGSKVQGLGFWFRFWIPGCEAVWLQAVRQTLLKKYARIRQDMDLLHNSKMSPYEKLECLDSIKSQIQSAWRTDEIRRIKPTPQASLHSSMQNGFAVRSGASHSAQLLAQHLLPGAWFLEHVG